MNIMQGARKLLARFWKELALVLAGVAIGAIGILMIAVRSQPESTSPETIKLQYTVKYIESAQTRLGIDCHALRGSLQDFLTSDIHPILKARHPKKAWNEDIGQDTRKRMEEMRDYYFACGRLYQAAQTVQWDGLNDLAFAIKLDREIITLNTLILFGDAFAERCDESCLDENFLELQDGVNRIEQVLKEQKPAWDARTSAR